MHAPNQQYALDEDNVDHVCPSHTVLHTERQPVIRHDIEAQRVYISLVLQELVVYCRLRQILMGVQCLEVAVNYEDNCSYHNYQSYEY